MIIVEWDPQLEFLADEVVWSIPSVDQVTSNKFDFELDYVLRELQGIFHHENLFTFAADREELNELNLPILVECWKYVPRGDVEDKKSRTNRILATTFVRLLASNCSQFNDGAPVVLVLPEAMCNALLRWGRGPYQLMSICQDTLGFCDGNIEFFEKRPIDYRPEFEPEEKEEFLKLGIAILRKLYGIEHVKTGLTREASRVFHYDLTGLNKWKAQLDGLFFQAW